MHTHAACLLTALVHSVGAGHKESAAAAAVACEERGEVAPHIPHLDMEQVWV